MFDFSDSGVTVTAMLDNRRANKEGLFPIKVRVTYQRERKYYSTGKALSIEDWERLADAKSKRLSGIKNAVQIASDKVKDEVKDLIKNDYFSFDNLNKRLGNSWGDTVNSAFKVRVADLFNDGKINTSRWYKDALNSFVRFGGENIKFNQITVDWLKRYEQYLLNKSYSYTTISMHARALQTIMNEAKNAGITKVARHPFGKGKYEIPEHSGRNMALPLKDIGRIANYDCVRPKARLGKAIWLFSYLCNGANIADICRFKFSNIQNNEICFYRKKTTAKSKRKRLIRALITSEMANIIAEFGNTNNGPDTYLFPFLKGGETPVEEHKAIAKILDLVNDQIEKIGKKLGIGHISTYTARHSFASVLKRSGANIAFISESLGHSDLKTTENYLASFEQEERAKNAALLTNF
ncbi:site-specific integrase [Adhaeribacter radiodurans]|uniref:Phage integrase SAM-like domain-containing protein n=1 Tax=Adhaeribacter radiodurans TaxID=2745197 RepID=A0A7L7LBA9_9BACT|nr:site-specific integrase [Adhaeribacter radiodurans]QMU30128.1 phage integrase SAM-like domain-containing protein [Adhaeribacter radiodurans]